MDIALQAVLTVSIITALLFAANLFGEHVAGLMSGLPFSTVPALLSIGLGRGAAAAADVASGAVVGCALASLFALAYHASSRRLSPARTLAIGVTVLAAGVALLSQLSLSLLLASGITGAGAALAWLVIRSAPQPPRSARPRTLTRDVGLALVAGMVGAALLAAARAMSPSLAGIVTAMPIIGVVAVASIHATRGSASVVPFLRAYVLSSVAKAVFCAAFALGVASHGMTVSLCVAAAFGGMVCLLPQGLRRWRERSPPLMPRRALAP